MIILVANVFIKSKFKIKFATMHFVTFLNIFANIVMIKHPLVMLYFRMYHPFCNQNLFIFNLFSHNYIFT
jgi:hypothetical protein